MPTVKGPELPRKQARRDSNGRDDLAVRPQLQRRWLFDDPTIVTSRRRRRAVLRWATGIMAVLLALGFWIRNGADGRARHRASRSAVEDDLGRLVVAQTAFRDEFGRFGTLEELGSEFISSQGVRIRLHDVNDQGWNASAWHLLQRTKCSVSWGTGSAALEDTAAGELECR